MTVEKPTLFGCAQSRIAEHSAPDCEISAIEPGVAPLCAKVAFRPISGRITPRQLGPRSRMRWRRTFSISARSSCSPRAPASEKPAESTTAARTPARAQDSMMPGTVGAGVAITAWSSRCGISSTEGKQGSPKTSRCAGSTANSLPA